MDGIFVDAATLLAEAAYAEPEHWSELFKRELYDWHDPEWLARDLSSPQAWQPLWLTKGYFAMVSARAYELAAESSWRANVQLDNRSGDITRVYAIRNGRRRAGESSIVYLHREITGAQGPAALVDHLNGYGLDNRDVNLRRADSHAENGSNKHGPARTKNLGLPIGVMRTSNGRYRGVVYRCVEGRRRAVRSAESWPSPEGAATWYQDQLAALHQRGEWVHNPRSVGYPDFPPRLDAEVSERSWQLRCARCGTPELADIPF